MQDEAVSTATRPILVAAPVVVPAGLQLAVLGSGVRLPVVQTAAVAPVEETAVVQSADNAVGGAAPFVAPAGPAVPVYPRKQARH